MGVGSGISFAVWGLVLAALFNGFMPTSPAFEGLLLFFFVCGGFVVGLLKG